MSENKLSIDVYNLIRDAFYAIPDFTDADGRSIGGLYGAFFKLKSLLETGDYDTVEFSFDVPDGAMPHVAYQAVRAGEYFLQFKAFEGKREDGDGEQG